MTKLYLVRHGETEYNKKGCYYGWTDCGLSLTGVEQAKNLGEVFQHIEYDVMISSDLKRAVETANIVNQDSKELHQDQRLRELNFGKWEGRYYKEVMAEHKEHWDAWVEDWINAKPTEGESVKVMHDRVCDFMEDLLNRYKEKNVVIVSHNGALRMIAAYLLGLPLDKIWCFDFDHGRYSLLEFQEGHCSIRYINNI